MNVANKIDAIAVYVVIEGKVCLAPIAEESAEVFVAMLSAFQAGSPRETKLIHMPDSVARHVHAAGLELITAINKKAAPQNEQPAHHAV